MPYDPKKHHRRSIRLPGYDYTSVGAYFVTICVHGGRCLLGDVIDDDMQLNAWGQIASDCWQEIPEHFDQVDPDEFVVMPNHVHGIIAITDLVGAQQCCAPTEPPPQTHTNVMAGSLGAIIRSYKSAVTKQINLLRDTPGAQFWQRNYWEHVIRDEQSLNRIREYIQNNPANWVEDQLHPDAPPNPFNQWIR
ncbi:MAG: transposase [Anaerolineae bacterium]|jgi:REP element-mobilizing transposase RayT